MRMYFLASGWACLVLYYSVILCFCFCEVTEALYRTVRVRATFGLPVVPPPFGCWPLAWRPPTLDAAPMLAIGAGGRVASFLPPPDAHARHWRWGEGGELPAACRRRWSPVALGGGLRASCLLPMPMLAIGAGGRAASFLPPPGAHARHWRWGGVCDLPASSRRPCSPLALGGGLRASCFLPMPMLAIDAGGRVASFLLPPGARGQPWRYTQRGRAPGRHPILGGTSHEKTLDSTPARVYNRSRQRYL